MPDKGTSKKLTRVGGGEPSPVPFVPTPESKSKARTFRIFAVVSWVVAIAFEVLAIILLRKPPVSTTSLIVLIAVDLVFAIVGSLLWKKANRLDPASEKDKVRFFVQNQLGVIIAIIAFLPLVILVFTNKDLNAKQRGLVGALALAALLVAGVLGVDFNPPSQEQYAEQTARVESLTGKNAVFWTKSGKSYHLYSDCSYINTARTSEIFQGTVAQARGLKNITDLCDLCARRAEKEKALPVGQPAAVEKK